MNESLVQRYKRYSSEYDRLQQAILTTSIAYQAQQRKFDEVVDEQARVVKALQALKDVRPLLAVSAISKAEQLANSAIETIFDFPAHLKYSEDDGRFIIETPNGDTDFQEGNGGGLQAVVSFVFNIFLLMKEGSRLFIALDEAFTQLSDVALGRFLEFLNALCDDLGLDILLVTHDQRIQDEAVKHSYRIEDGKAIRIK